MTRKPSPQQRAESAEKSAIRARAELRALNRLIKDGWKPGD